MDDSAYMQIYDLKKNKKIKVVLLTKCTCINFRLFFAFFFSLTKHLDTKMG